MPNSLTVRPLLSADAALVDAFLRPHTAKAFYLRSNAKLVGLDSFDSDMGGDYLGAFNGDELTGIAAYSWSHMILFYATDRHSSAVLAGPLREQIIKRGGKLSGIMGINECAETMLKGLALPPDAFRFDDIDKLYLFDQIDSLRTKPASPLIRLAEAKDTEQLISWRLAFDQEALSATPGKALEKAIRFEIMRRIPLREYYVLEKDNQLLAMCSLSGSLPESAILGAVWTPPPLRGKGLAKQMVSGAMAHCANTKTRLNNVVLFASHPEAIHVYESIGFKYLADWRFSLMKDGFALPHPFGTEG